VWCVVWSGWSISGRVRAHKKHLPLTTRPTPPNHDQQAGMGAPLYDCFAVSNHYGGMGGGEAWRFGWVGWWLVETAISDALRSHIDCGLNPTPSAHPTTP